MLDLLDLLGSLTTWMTDGRWSKHRGWLTIQAAVFLVLTAFTIYVIFRSIK
ncbi:hypothetical protein M2281_005768 [Mesorhizobium soli]|uniref:hypothetical protein n=1 Tax=Pseudaminobacter soli (ex Li et al. 2025) TaxID=1295366 RepID=UPI0024749447|nr:hypothetical protein [Mesorhizobium soli]MDH6235146.1 hypothetical protein [Mesorhizobium soli]